MNIQQSDLPETSAHAIQTPGTQSTPKPQHRRHTQRYAVLRAVSCRVQLATVVVAPHVVERNCVTQIVVTSEYFACSSVLCL